MSTRKPGDGAFVGARLETPAMALLAVSLIPLLAHAFIPLEEFIHRGDDAFYYFKVAANYPRLGFWSFDGIHSTNGVQPLWAVLLTAIAQLLSWVGIDDLNGLSRVFVGLGALLHFASSMLLFHLLAKRVSLGTGVAAAGAFLFPMGIVWTRVWGMENSLYALMLVSTMAYFHLVFLERGSLRTAVGLGLLLGLTTLARLNAGLLVPCLLLFYLIRVRREPFAERLRLSSVAGAAAALLILPYIAANYISTGHPLPISGAVKAFNTGELFRTLAIDGRLSADFLSFLIWERGGSVRWFLTSRSLDGMWIAGSRLVFDGATSLPVLLSLLAGWALGPALLGQPREWLRFVRGRFARLSPFGYFLVFGVLDALVSVALYPSELGYAMTRWWFVENEIIIVVLVATLVMASINYSADRVIPRRATLIIATAVLALVIVFHVQQMLRFYYDGRITARDWNPSWNDESYRASQWLSNHAPPNALVGSWNAGVVGYYSRQRVVNLDGLINNFDLLPYLREKRIADYIKRERIDYLSDMDDMFRRQQLRHQLRLTEVYSHYSPLMKQQYRIYRVER